MLPNANSLAKMIPLKGPEKDHAVIGHHVLAGLESQPLLEDIGVLTFIMTNPDFVPDACKGNLDEWRGSLGAITPCYYVRCSHPELGQEYVPCVFWNGVEWRMHALHLNSAWDVGCMGLMLSC